MSISTQDLLSVSPQEAVVLMFNDAYEAAMPLRWGRVTAPTDNGDGTVTVTLSVRNPISPSETINFSGTKALTYPRIDIQSVLGAALSDYGNSYVEAAQVVVDADTPTQATLTDDDGNPIPANASVTVQSLYQTDWQGRTLLSQTPRTNLLWPSYGSNRRGINGATEVTVTEGIEDPNGGTNATRIVNNAAANNCGPYWAGSTQGLTNSEVYDCQIAVRGINGVEAVNFHMEGNANNVVQLTTSWQLLTVQGTYTGTGALTCYMVAGANGLHIGDGIEFAFPGIFPQGEGGVSIPTNTGPVTIPDYTYDSSTIDLGQAANEDASYSWTGWMSYNFPASGALVPSDKGAIFYDAQGQVVPRDQIMQLSGIYQTDWQGRQLLYPEARTNITIDSDFQSTGTPFGTSPPVMGTTTLYGKPCASCTFSANGTSGFAASNGRFGNFGITSGQNLTGYVWITLSRPLTGSEVIDVYATGSQGQQGMNINAANCSDYVGQWGMVAIPSTEITHTGNNAFAVFVISPLSSDLTVYATAGEMEVGDTAGSYIKTTTAPVTVTDYTQTVSSDGFLVSIEASPGATYDWEGSVGLPLPGSTQSLADAVKARFGIINDENDFTIEALTKDTPLPYVLKANPNSLRWTGTLTFGSPPPPT